MLLLKDVLAKMRSEEESFSLAWWTANLKEQTGGELRKLPRARLVQASKKGKRTLKAWAQESPATKHRQRKDPDHYANDTINVECLDTGAIKKVHVRLIEHYNHQKVIW